MMKKMMSFFFIFIFIPTGNVLAQGELPEFSGPIVPQKCIGGGPLTCGSCELLQLAQNIINFFIFFAVVTAVLMFVYAGFKYITAVGNPGQISSAHKIFWNVFIGLVIVLAAWLIIDLLMKSFYVEGDLGPWNDILCAGISGVVVKPPPSTAPPLVVVPPPPSTSKNICYEITEKKFLKPTGSGTWEECLSTEPDCELKRIAITGIKYADDSKCSSSCSTGVAICSNPSSLTTGDPTIIIDPVIKSASLAIDEYTEAEARGILASNGILVNKDPCPTGVKYQDVSGGCTSLEGVKQDTIDGILLLQQECNTSTGGLCSLIVTGGTEAGHAAGTFSHENGYKLDLDQNSSIDLDSYLSSQPASFTLFDSSTGVFYDYVVINEGNHWDVRVR